MSRLPESVKTRLFEIAQQHNVIECEMAAKLGALAAEAEDLVQPHLIDAQAVEEAMDSVPAGAFATKMRLQAKLSQFIGPEEVARRHEEALRRGRAIMDMLREPDDVPG